LIEFQGWLPDGFQIRKIRRPVKDVPEWANSQFGIVCRVLGPAGIRNLRIAYLYWRVGWNAREIAEELGMTGNAVKQVLQKLKVSR
jgi:hypothetical protein